MVGGRDGYLPLANAAAKALEASGHYAKQPKRRTTVGPEMNSGKTTPKAGIRLRNFTSVRDAIEEQMEHIFSGDDGQAGLDDAVAKSNEILKEFAALYELDGGARGTHKVFRNRSLPYALVVPRLGGDHCVLLLAGVNMRCVCRCPGLAVRRPADLHRPRQTRAPASRSARLPAASPTSFSLLGLVVISAPGRPRQREDPRAHDAPEPAPAACGIAPAMRQHHLCSSSIRL